MKVEQEKNSDLAVFSLLSLIKEHGSISQVQLSDLSGYSRSTVSINCDKLASMGFIISDSSSTTNKRKNIQFRLNKNLGYILGLGLGGSNCRIALFDIEGTMIESVCIPVDLMRGPEPVLELICTQTDELLKKHQENNAIPLLGIGMGLPSPVQYEEGMAFYPAFMPGWHLFPVKTYLSSRYHCHVFIDNEVNTLALGEFAELKDRKLKTLMCVKVGTGIGAGIIIDGNIYRGEKGGGGNIGHIRVDNTTPCSCGKIGCIEAVASVPAVEKKAEQLAEQHQESMLAKIYKQQKRITVNDIKSTADQGDRLALQIIQDAGMALGGLIGKLTVFLDPGMLIIAGRLTALGPTYLDYIRKATLLEAAPWVDAAFAIEFSKLKEDSSATGAALLCTSELFKRQLITKIAGQ